MAFKKHLCAIQASLCLLSLALGQFPVDSPSGKSQSPPKSCTEDDPDSMTVNLLQVEMQHVKGASPPVDHPPAPVHGVLPNLAASATAQRGRDPCLLDRFPSATAQFAAETLAATWAALPRYKVESVHTMMLAFLASITTVILAISCMKTQGKAKSMFSLIAHPVGDSTTQSAKARRNDMSVPPWERTGTYSREARKGAHTKSKKNSRSSKSAEPAALASHDHDEATFRLPPLNPALQGDLLSEECYVISLDGLKQLWRHPVSIKSLSGKIVLEATIHDESDDRRLLHLTLSGQNDGPHATVDLGSESSSMVLFGHKASQPYGSFVSQAGGGLQLQRQGQTAVLLQAGFEADLRMMALSPAGEFLASGGRYLGVRRDPAEVWKLRVCSGVDALVIIASMLAAISLALPDAAAAANRSPQSEVDADMEDIPLS